MKNNNKFLSGLILGAAAGAAIALFFSSENGKEVLEDVKETAEELGKEIKDKIGNIDKEMKALAEKGKLIMEELENKATQTIIS